MTTLFLEPEVRELATRIHVGIGNDIEPFLADRISKSLERKAARERSRLAKRNHLHRALIANGLTQPPTLINTLAHFLEPGRDRRPAMPVLEIVRMKLLQQRLQTENLHLQPRYNIFRDSRDKALFELFCREFDLLPPQKQTNSEDGEVEIEDRIKLYEHHRKEWAWTSIPEGVTSMLRKQIIISPSRHDSWENTVSILNEPPWSWACFPILVKDAAATVNPDHTTSPKEAREMEKELNKINKWNEKAESEMARITALIKERGLDKKLWGPTSKQFKRIGQIPANTEAAQILQKISHRYPI
ncbi:uncharacterized protein H6S33_000466 [Morchella sextelata]|uniref:uncharacterized protein n=1 Tax=Morchella sextelata TaxID=1174677 RepID=UPI001D0365DB|nr:uncharacterized protein H6S33_000466 [Morchella sextelata]KAH0614830.1 hypothetical protein H6S33_000466 [Morchella sextelata]